MATTVVDDAAQTGPAGIDPFRQRLLDGLAAAIDERGYRASTVADIVRHARTSKRTFYDQFPSKEQCFHELLHASVELLGERIRDAVDPKADWQIQIRQAVEAYVGHIESTPALTLAWIRELPCAGRRGAAVAAPQHPIADQPAGQLERHPGDAESRSDAADRGEGRHPGRRPSRADSPSGRGRAQPCATSSNLQCRPR